MEILTTTIICLACILACYYNENIIRFLSQLTCKLGRHNYRKNRYYCKKCKKPRKWPDLKCHKGGKRDWDAFRKL